MQKLSLLLDGKISANFVQPRNSSYFLIKNDLYQPKLLVSFFIKNWPFVYCWVFPSIFTINQHKKKKLALLKIGPNAINRDCIPGAKKLPPRRPGPPSPRPAGVLSEKISFPEILDTQNMQSDFKKFKNLKKITT